MISSDKKKQIMWAIRTMQVVYTLDTVAVILTSEERWKSASLQYQLSLIIDRLRPDRAEDFGKTAQTSAELDPDKPDYSILQCLGHSP